MCIRDSTLGAVVTKDISIGKSFVDNCSNSGVVFTGTDKELSNYVDDLYKQGYNIQDFYDHE